MAKGNPYHVRKGKGGGQFTSQTGQTGSGGSIDQAAEKFGKAEQKRANLRAKVQAKLNNNAPPDAKNEERFANQAVANQKLILAKKRYEAVAADKSASSEERQAARDEFTAASIAAKQAAEERSNPNKKVAWDKAKGVPGLEKGGLPESQSPDIKMVTGHHGVVVRSESGGQTVFGLEYPVKAEMYKGKVGGFTHAKIDEVAASSEWKKLGVKGQVVGLNHPSIDDLNRSMEQAGVKPTQRDRNIAAEEARDAAKAARREKVLASANKKVKAWRKNRADKAGAAARKAAGLGPSQEQLHEGLRRMTGGELPRQMEGGQLDKDRAHFRAMQDLKFNMDNEVRAAMGVPPMSREAHDRNIGSVNIPEIEAQAKGHEAKLKRAKAEAEYEAAKKAFHSDLDAPLEERKRSAAEFTKARANLEAMWTPDERARNLAAVKAAGINIKDNPEPGDILWSMGVEESLQARFGPQKLQALQNMSKEIIARAKAKKRGAISETQRAKNDAVMKEAKKGWDKSKKPWSPTNQPNLKGGFKPKK